MRRARGAPCGLAALYLLLSFRLTRCLCDVQASPDVSSAAACSILFSCLRKQSDCVPRRSQALRSHLPVHALCSHGRRARGCQLRRRSLLFRGASAPSTATLYVLNTPATWPHHRGDWLPLRRWRHRPQPVCARSGAPHSRLFRPWCAAIL